MQNLMFKVSFSEINFSAARGRGDEISKFSTWQTSSLRRLRVAEEKRLKGRRKKPQNENIINGDAQKKRSSVDHL